MEELDFELEDDDCSIYCCYVLDEDGRDLDE